MSADEKLDQLSQLTAGIAHEIRNPLQFIVSHAEVVSELGEELANVLLEYRDRLPDAASDDLVSLHDELKTASTQIVRHASRLDGIVESMLATGTNKVARRQLVDLNELVAESADLAYRSFAASVDASIEAPPALELAEDVPPVMVDPVRLSQAVINLVSNALQACAELVRRTVESPVVVATGSEGGNCWVRVTDQGHGLTDAVRERMFEPFFTTKSGREHAGLGLAQVRDIVSHDHAGTIEVTGGVGEATVVTITFPIQLEH